MENNFARFAIVVSKETTQRCKNLLTQIQPCDKVFYVDFPKFPTRVLEKLYFSIRNSYDYMVIINEKSNKVIDNFLDDYRNKKLFSGILFKRTFDENTNFSYRIINKKMISVDDSVFIPLKSFNGFRHIKPQSTFSEILISLATLYTPYGDENRLKKFESKSNEIKTINSVSHKETVEKTKTEREDVSVNAPFNGVTLKPSNLITKKQDGVGDWNTWMLN